MVSLPPDSTLSPLCLNTLCHQRERCRRFMTHWQAGASIATLEGGERCSHFVPMPRRPRAEDVQDAERERGGGKVIDMRYRTSRGAVLDRSGE
jgi:hypothetical protein